MTCICTWYCDACGAKVFENRQAKEPEDITKLAFAHDLPRYLCLECSIKVRRLIRDISNDAKYAKDTKKEDME